MLILFTYIAGCMFCLLIDRVSYLINGSVMAVPAILGSFAFILIKERSRPLREDRSIFIQPLKVRDVVLAILHAHHSGSSYNSCRIKMGPGGDTYPVYHNFVQILSGADTCGGAPRDHAHPCSHDLSYTCGRPCALGGRIFCHIPTCPPSPTYRASSRENSGIILTFPVSRLCGHLFAHSWAGYSDLPLCRHRPDFSSTVLFLYYLVNTISVTSRSRS